MKKLFLLLPMTCTPLAKTSLVSKTGDITTRYTTSILYHLKVGFHDYGNLKLLHNNFIKSVLNL